LRRADVITALAGQPVSDLADLRNRIAMLSVGTNVELTYYRDGKKGSAQVVIAELPTLRSLGIRMEREARRPSESLPGVAIEQVQMGSPAFRAGLRPGQRILAIGSRSVATRDEAEAVAGRFDVNKGIDLDVLDRNGERHDVKLGGRVQPPRVGE
jgi:serine protease Do/serine protease DegQ